MSAGAPGTSLAAQLRQQRAALRRAARKKITTAIQALHGHERAYLARRKELERDLETANRELRELEDRLRGRNQTPEIEFASKTD